MPKKIIPKDQLIVDLQNNLSKIELRKKYNCSGTTLLKYISEYNIDFKFKKDYNDLLTKEFLEQTDLTLAQISKQYNISQTSLWKYINKHNITYVKNKKGIQKLSDKEWLFDEYVTKNKTLIQLEKELNTSRETIKKYLKIHNIPKKERYKERLSKEILELSETDIIRLYCEDNISTIEISKTYNCNPEYIRQILIKNNIARNSGYNASIYEKKIQNILTDLNIPYIANSKSIIPPYELDIYIKDYNIAIEINGVYFHSNKFLDKKYHENKRKLCENRGIRLIQIFEDDLIYKFDIIKKFIENIFDGKSYIHARKCKIVKNIDIQTKKNFMEDNHIQGYAKNNYSIGLEYCNELVALMLFEGDVLTRYATSRRVQGGFSKLIKNSQLNFIKTFVDLSMFTGKTYFKSGFVLDKYIPPDYKYVINNKRIHKFNFRKSAFKKNNFKFDPTLTESELAKLNNIHKIYDSGKLRLVWQNQHQEKN